MPAAMAIECVHTFSLIHDDLPALDDDDYRRGVATSHKVFGEATALLAGDALMALAFQIVAGDVDDPVTANAMTLELASATGGAGMIGGELRDIEAEAQRPDAATTEAIHAAKTARLIQSACRLGAMAAAADKERFEAVSAYGHALGLAFQIADDLLDVTGTLATLGKRTGKDETAGKQTMHRAVGLAESGRIAAQRVEQAVAALAPFGASGARLAALAHYAIDRKT
jgi:geranylgeranyl pyrophosphate synthase